MYGSSMVNSSQIELILYFGNLNVEQSMSSEFVYCLMCVQIHLT